MCDVDQASDVATEHPSTSERASRALAVGVALLLVQCAPPVVFKGYQSVWSNAARFAKRPSIQHHVLSSKQLKRQVGYTLYLPADYETSQTRYPVVYFLHGAYENETTCYSMLQGRNPTYIIVFPNAGHETMYANHHAGKLQVHDYLVKELIPHIDATYRTLADREHRIAAGFSMGGWGAHMLAYKHPELFGAVQSLAGAFHTSEQLDEELPGAWREMFGKKHAHFAKYSPRAQLRANVAKLRGRIKIQMYIGGKDYLLPINAEMHALLKSLLVQHEYVDPKTTPALADVDHDRKAYLAAIAEPFFAFQKAFFFGR
jgi:S-formylglutathione hydrolase FrmB